MVHRTGITVSFSSLEYVLDRFLISECSVADKRVDADGVYIYVQCCARLWSKTRQLAT